MLFLFRQILVAACLLISLTTHAEGIDHQLQWGPYRPNLYVGLRPTVPKSLLLGLMWANNDDDPTSANWRHTCEQDEGMAGYGWTHYDARHGGQHIVNDTRHKIDLVSEFGKSNDVSNHDRWGLRVKGLLRDDALPTQRTTVVFYIGSEDPKSKVTCSHQQLTFRSLCQGSMSVLPDFELQVVSSKTSDPDSYDRMFVDNITVAPDTIWQAKTFLEQEIAARSSQPGMIPQAPGRGNLHFIQMRFEGAFEFDISYQSSPPSAAWTAHGLSDSLNLAEYYFEQSFESVYPPSSPFLGPDDARFSKALVSNLMGGIGYFYGTSKVVPASSSEETATSQLFSAVPSRPFFPRGFLWDEGFHLLVILEWDMDLALEMVNSWLDLMDDDGWIAREQILGPEARSKVPDQFQTQHRDYANPPTLFLVVEAFLARLNGVQAYSGSPSRYLSNEAEGKALLADLYSKLGKHYEWWRRTQAADLTAYQLDAVAITEGYRWRGQTEQHILTSGLDDYPRAHPPSTQDLHLDALCWVGVMSGVLEKLALDLADTDGLRAYVKQRNAVMVSLEYLHWSAADGMYCDVTVSNAGAITKVCHEGYISLFPFFTGLMDPNHLDALLKTICDPNRLWTQHGLRSLSAKDEQYGSGEDYWRGPVWININYLVLAKLREYGEPQSPHRELIRETYSHLRLNLVNTVLASWKQTGFAWEQYNDRTGKGQRTQHFTGWTALVSKIMAMPGNEYDGRSSSRIMQPGQRAASSYRLLVAVVVLASIATIFRRRLKLTWAKLMQV